MAYYKEIIEYLERSDYPSSEMSKAAKRDFRKRTKDFFLESGILFYKGSRQHETVHLRQVLSDKETQRRAMKQCHEGNGSSHFGRDKTREKLESRYYWKGMYNDILSFITSCDNCQRVNAKLRKTMPSLHPISVPSGAWKQVGIDLIGPLPQTKKGNKYIITMVDYFTKCPEAAALPDKTAKGVADFIYWTIKRNGCAAIQISDQGREFVNQVSELLHNRTGTEHCVTSAYHPQSNGLTERFNQTLEKALTKTINESQNNWDEFIDDILFAYRTAKHDSTSYTPFYLMFGREARLPIEMELAPCVRPCSEPDLEMRVKELQQLRNDYTAASQKIASSQAKQKQQYDKKHGTTRQEFDVGSLVLMRNAKEDSRKGGKLASKYLGPYTITKYLGKNVYHLTNASTGKELKKKVNAALLKPYLKSSDDKPSDEPSLAKSSYWKDSLLLTQDDRATLEDSSKMLSDSHIYAALQLLNKSHPHLSTCQDPLLYQCTGFVPADKGEFVQILNVGGNHWVTVASDGYEVSVYDSLSRKMHQRLKTKGSGLPSDLQVQISQIVHQTMSIGEIPISVPAVHQQVDGTSCGVFAVAFAVEAAMGVDLSQIRFDEDRNRMRGHLLSCLEAERLLPFPKIHYQKKRNTDAIQTMIQVHCQCRLPECLNDMIFCDLCQEWKHYKCEGITSMADIDDEDSWLCRTCRPPHKRLRFM